MASNHMLCELTDTSDLVEFFPKLNLYLTPLARLNISVTLPQLKDPGQSISNWDLMERVKKLVFPTQFTNIRVARSTIEFVRFEADLQCKSVVKKDTIYLAHLPTKWFVDPRQPRAANGHELPSEKYLRRLFETFGEVRCVDIPVTDPFRPTMSKNGMRMTGFSFGQDVTFEAYVQFVEYISFSRAMDALRGMKLVHVDDQGKPIAAEIKVEFDKTKHLSDKSIRRRRLEREKLSEVAERKAKEEAALKAAAEAKRAAAEAEVSARRSTRAERRKLRRAAKRQLHEAEEMERRIRAEERKLLVAQRRLESVRVLDVLFARLKWQKVKEEVNKIEEDLEEEVRRRGRDTRKREGSMRQKLLRSHEDRLRNKMQRKFAESEADRLDRRRAVLAEQIKRETVDVSASPSPISDEDTDQDHHRRGKVQRGRRHARAPSRSESARPRSSRSRTRTRSPSRSRSPSHRRRRTGTRPYASAADLVQIKAEPSEPGEEDRWQHDKFFEYNPPERRKEHYRSSYKERGDSRSGHRNLSRHADDRSHRVDDRSHRADDRSRRHEHQSSRRPMHRVATAPAPIAVVHSAIVAPKEDSAQPATSGRRADRKRHGSGAARLSRVDSKRAHVSLQRGGVAAESQSPSSSGSLAIRVSPHSTKQALLSTKRNVRIIIEDRSGGAPGRSASAAPAAGAAGDQFVYVGYSSDEAGQPELPDDPVPSAETGRRVLG